MKLEKTSAHLERRRTVTLIIRVSLGLAALTTVAMDIGRARSPFRHGPSETLILIFLGCLGVAGVARAMRFRGFKVFDSPGTVVVDDEAIAFDTSRGSGWVPLAEVEEVLCSGAGDLGFRRGNGDVLHLQAPGEIAVLLAAVEAGGMARAVRVTLGDTRFVIWVGSLLGLPAGIGMTYFSAHLPTAIVNVGVFAASWYGVFLASRAILGPDTLLVGVDGVTVETAFSSRFIPLDNLDRVDPQPDRVRLHLKDGRVVTAATRHLTQEVCSLLARRLKGALRASQRKAPTLELAELDRGGRPVAAWRRALAGLLLSDKAYRRAPVTAEDLVSILSNPEIGAERRLGAAIALAASDAPGMRQRVRIAAYASASGPMRLALRRLAEGRSEDAAIEKALAAESR